MPATTTATRPGEHAEVSLTSSDDRRPDHEEARSRRRPRWRSPGAIGLVLAVVALLGALYLVAGPGRGVRSDIDAQRTDVGAQRDLITQQRDITAQQLAIARQQLDIVTQQLAEARTTRGISEETRDLAKRQLELTNQTIALQQRLLAIAEETLQHVRSIDQKTPSTPRSPVTP